MVDYLESLERLAMPDELHIKECEKLGISLTEDFDLVEQALLELKSIKDANPSEALKCLEKLKGMEISSMPFSDEYGTQEVDLNDIRKVGSQLNTDFREYTTTIKQALLKAQEQEKENEILKEIIKSLFDKGCPLHQYTDKDFGLTIEVDNECSIMHLGKFKGVDLDKKLKEALDNE